MNINARDSLAKGKNKGMALIIVICLLAVFTALSLAVLLSASVLANNSEKNHYRDQARIAAVTLMQSLERDLTSPDDSDVKSYLLENMLIFEQGTWTFYDETTGYDINAYTRVFDLPDNELAGNMTASISIYWEAEGAVMDDLTIETKDKCSTVTLCASVTCVAEGESYTLNKSFGVTCTESQPGELSFTWYAKGAE